MDAGADGTAAPPPSRGRRPLWLLRLGIVAFVVAYFLSPDGLQVWVPVWLPFLAALGVELHFLVQGLRTGRPRVRGGGGPGPQPRDLADLGWQARTVEVPYGDATLELHCGAMDAQELAAWVERNAEELAALGPGRHELGPVEPGGGVRPWRPPPPAAPASRIRDWLVPAVVVLGLAALLVAATSRRQGWSSLDPGAQVAATRLVSTEAGRIAGHRAEVVCDEQGAKVGYVQDADGLAEVGGRRAWLTPSICVTLYRLDEGHHVPDGIAGRAIAVLAHEAWHLRGVADEGVADCYAFQTGVGLGRRLGLSAGRASELMRSQLADNRAVANSAYRVPDGCTDGGRYDLDASTSRFP